MFIWSIVWFWFKIEYIVDVDINKNFFLSLFPNMSYSRSYPDHIGCRNHQFSINFLNLTFNIHYYYPSNYFFSGETGEFIGIRKYPSIRIENIEFHKQEEDI